MTHVRPIRGQTNGASSSPKVSGRRAVLQILLVTADEARFSDLHSPSAPEQPLGPAHSISARNDSCHAGRT